MDVLRSVPMSETSLSEQDRSQVVLRAMFNGDKTYDNQTEEIHQSWRTTYREWNHQVSGTCTLLGQSSESICNYGSCLHGGERDGDGKRVQG